MERIEGALLQRCETSQNVGCQPDISAREKINYQVSGALLISRSWHINGAAKIVCLQKKQARLQLQKLKLTNSSQDFPLIHFSSLATPTSHVSSSSANVQVRPPQEEKVSRHSPFAGTESPPLPLPLLPSFTEARSPLRW